MEAEGLSPLVFPSAPRGRGRPKTKNQRQGAPIAPRCLKRKAFSFVPDCLAQYKIQPAPKKRGRPKGSKNKQVGFVDEFLDIPLTQRTHAELGASPEEDSFIDSGDYCDICGFRFNDPIKAKKNGNQVQGMLDKCPQTVYRERWLYLSAIDNPTKCFKFI